MNLCCELYNSALQERRDAWKINRISINFHSQANQLPEIKLVRPEYDDVYSQVSQDVLRRLSKAFDNFFRRVKGGEKPGHPRFKSHARYDSFTYVQSGFKLVGDILILSKIGSVKIKQHRPIEGTIKTCTIKRESNGWYVIFACETESSPLPKTGKFVGIDVGLSKFATLTTGEAIDNRRFFRTDEKALAKAQRLLSKEAKGTKQRRKRVGVVQKIHRRIKNRRNNFAHQLSRKLVNNFDVIVFEDLNIKGMTQNHCHIAKSIADAAWNQLITFTTYKAEDAGKVCVKVNPSYTSQDCSQCGNRVKKDLSERIHHCLQCGLVLNRDLNAARNILARGLSSLGFALEAPSKPCLVGD